MERGWTWETGTPKERGEMIRQHMTGTRPLTHDQTCKLFHLRACGLDAILRGDDWRPEWSTPDD